MSQLRASVASIIIGLLTVFAVPATALAAGSNYLPPAPAPVKSGHVSSTSTSAQAAAQPACQGAVAPAIDIDSPSENDVEENPAGVWTLYLYSADQDYARWVAYWTTTPDITYDFEVSASPNTDPSTGKFVSPIAAYHVNGNIGNSDEIPISNGQTYYFHLNATGSNGCPGQYVGGQITAVYDEGFYGGGGSIGQSGGSTGTKLLELSMVGAALALLVSRDSIMPRLRAAKARLV